jgi:dephospho-CoA kinase
MITIGLTGGIGSGKSTVARLLETMDIPVYDSDREAKKIVSESEFVKNSLSGRFGPEIYLKGVLNKTLLSFLLFGNENNLKFANAIIHPEVRKDFIHWKKQREDKPFAVIESAILFESGFDKCVDVIVTVSAPPEIRIERAQKRDKVSSDEVLNRIKTQMPEEERNKKSTYVIVNDNYRPILPQVEDILKKLNS